MKIAMPPPIRKPLPLTPLVDIVFLLLIFFMLSSNFLKLGHQEVGATSCPGSIQGSLQWVRNRARNWYDWTAAMHNPIGRADGVTGGDGVITSAGFAYDPDTSSPIEVI